jgi:HSP20 family protein
MGDAPESVCRQEVITMLMRFDPFRDVDRLLEQTFGGDRTPLMPMDAYRRGEDFFVHLDLPGVDPSSVEVSVEKNVLIVKAQRAWQRHEGDEWLVAERPQGTYSRQLFLGDTLDADHIEASYHDGVLTLRIPVAEQAKPRRIEINTESNQQTAIEARSTEHA